MKTLFYYNWRVREEWYEWCEQLTYEELLQDRVGGVGGILKTLFHIIDVEWSWIRVLKGEPDPLESFEDFNTLGKVRELDAKFHQEVAEFVENWDKSMELKLLQETRPDGKVASIPWGEVMGHILAHEIHHIGQLSVWAREIGKAPVSANLVGRGLMGVPYLE
jgi:uncharacterized damage-inducible protein DinB